MEKLVYKSEVMTKLVEMAERVAKSNANILITGEAGTGKTLLARHIHYNSSRDKKPLVTLNCGALRETLLESELFGHEKGAFTGAYTRKIGLLEIANFGTLLLTDIDELSAGTQAKLLVFLKTGGFYRVGGNTQIIGDVRLITTTSKDIHVEVSKDNFSEELYYKMDTVTLNTPPLRRRKEDILDLSLHFISEHFGSPTSTVTGISEGAVEKLRKYDWPGNVRELQNTIGRMMVLSENKYIEPSDIPESIKENEGLDGVGYGLETPLHEVEKDHILKVLKHFNNNKTRAAHALGITIKTLYNKLHLYGEFDNFKTHDKEAE